MSHEAIRDNQSSGGTFGGRRPSQGHPSLRWHPCSLGVSRLRQSAACDQCISELRQEQVQDLTLTDVEGQNFSHQFGAICGNVYIPIELHIIKVMAKAGTQVELTKTEYVHRSNHSESQDMPTEYWGHTNASEEPITQGEVGGIPRKGIVCLFALLTGLPCPITRG